MNNPYHTYINGSKAHPPPLFGHFLNIFGQISVTVFLFYCRLGTCAWVLGPSLLIFQITILVVTHSLSLDNTRADQIWLT